MQHDADKYLYDALHAVAQIGRFLEGYSLQRYLDDERTICAVERNFITIGEALGKLRHTFPESEGRISRIHAVTGFRNFIVHEYDKVDDEQVFDIARHSLPLLREELTIWLRELAQSSFRSNQ